MEFGGENINSKNMNINSLSLKSSASQQMTVRNVYNLTLSQISNLEDDVKTQSLITLTDATLSNSSQCSRHNLSVHNNENTSTKNIPEFLKDLVEDIYNNAFVSQPQILFNASKRCKKLRRKLPMSTKQKYQKRKCLVKTCIVHFKCKHPRKNMKRKLGHYYDKTKRNCYNPKWMRQELRTDTVLKTVSRSTILKKVSSKANLLGEADEIFTIDINQDKMLHIDASDYTLTGFNSELSQNDSIKAVSSVIKLPIKTPPTEPTSTLTLIQSQCKSLELFNPSIKSTFSNETYPLNNDIVKVKETIFTTDIISVAVAQINETSILKYKTETNSGPRQEKMLYEENLTSSESLSTLSNAAELTSSLEIAKNYPNNNLKSNNDDKKCVVLTDMINTFNNDNSSDTFVIANTSSDFKDNSDLSELSSNRTLTPSSEINNTTEPCNIFYQSAPKREEIKSTLLDTIINVEMYQMPQSSSENEYNTELSNKVIISDELGKIPLPNKVQPMDKYSKKVIQKTFSVDNEGDGQKKLNLPNEDTIKSIVTGAEKIEKICSEEFPKFTPPTDIWEKMSLYFDVALNRMEESLVTKIKNEVNYALSKFEKYLPFIHENGLLESNNMKSSNKTNNEKDLCKMESGYLTYFDESMQCCLVNNDIIDELTSKMKVEGDTIIIEDFPLKLIKNKVKVKDVHNDTFEVFKSPIGPCSSTGKEKGDSLLNSSSESVRIEKLNVKRSTNNLMLCLTVPIQFIKTNMLVIASVPAFFVSVFLVYKFFVLLL